MIPPPPRIRQGPLVFFLPISSRDRILRIPLPFQFPAAASSHPSRRSTSPGRLIELHLPFFQRSQLNIMGFLWPPGSIDGSRVPALYLICACLSQISRGVLYILMIVTY